jgi:glycosyltransferase involved in cell wall biosynthesis
MCRCAAANICITEHVSRRVRLPRSSVIYYGLPANDDVARLLPAPGNSRPVVFAFVGRITGEKGLPILLKAASILKTEGRKFALRLVGDGPDRLECERLARQLDLGDRLVVTGFLNGERLRQELEDVSVVVMPSIWEETAGLAAMEQMIRGRMVIAADIGGLSEVVGDAGLKFKPGDIVGLADRMRQILDAPAIIERFGECAGKRASQLYRQEQMVERYICAFNAVTQKLHFR